MKFLNTRVMAIPRVAMALLMAVMGLLTIMVPAAMATGTSVELSSASIASGGTCTITVQIKNVALPGLGAYDFRVDFDNTKVRLDNVTGGTATGFTGSPTQGPPGFPGYVTFNAYQTAIPGPTGNLLVANLNFTGLAQGTATLTLSIGAPIHPSGALADSEGTEIAATIVNGQITVVVPPVADFSASTTTGTAPLAVTFTDTSTGPPTSWAWDVNNDGTVDYTTQNCSHTYTAAGNYTVKLTATNSAGTDSKTKTNYISVYSVPVAAFSASPTTGTAPLAVSFTDTSTGNIVSWAWDFKNDGTATSTVKNPSYTYTSTGSYSVKLTVTNPAGTAFEIKTGYITVISFVADISLTQVKDTTTGSPTFGYIVLEAKITRTYNPTTNTDVTIPGGLGAYDGIATFNSAGVTMVNALGVAPFDGSFTKYLSVAGQATFNSTQTTAAPQAPMTVAKLVPRLTGSAATGNTYTITLHYITLSAGDSDGTEFNAAADASLTFWRGNAKPDTAVNITDALFIAQYLAGVRLLDTLNALNAASIKQDGTIGDKITITDALFLAQKLAGLRDNNFNLITPP